MTSAISHQPGHHNQIKTILLGGHPRSGTTLLTNICNSHPDILVTFEFNSFGALNSAYPQYVATLRKNLRQRRIISKPKRWGQRGERLYSAIFLGRYLLALHRYRGQPIDAAIVSGVLHQIFPWAAVIGDKMPHYVFQLDRLATDDTVLPIVIYRDCRDVVRSTLEKARTTWRNKSFVSSMDTANKVAARWVQAIDQMEQHATRVHIIRYEELVRRPQPVLHALANCLGLDPAGFDAKRIRTSSIGRHKENLSSQELAAIRDIAGPTMRRMGYRI